MLYKQINGNEYLYVGFSCIGYFFDIVLTKLIYKHEGYGYKNVGYQTNLYNDNFIKYLL